MSDDKTKRLADAKRISLAERYEVEYWTGALGITEAELREAVAAAGHSAKAVRAHLADRRV